MPATAPAAAVCLAVLFIGMFSANVRAAREYLKRSRRSGMACRIRHGFDWS
jgi:hypothetical protein